MTDNYITSCIYVSVVSITPVVFRSSIKVSFCLLLVFAHKNDNTPHFAPKG